MSTGVDGREERKKEREREKKKSELNDKIIKKEKKRAKATQKPQGGFEKFPNGIENGAANFVHLSNASLAPPSLPLLTK